MTSLAVAFFITAFISVSYALVSQTSGNSTHQYFITSQSSPTNFRSDNIQCTATNCYVTCDIDSGCNGTSIDASATDTLTIRCSARYSCFGLQIQQNNAPSTNLNLHCAEYRACYETPIDVGQVANVYLEAEGTYATQDMTLSTSNMPTSSRVTINCVDDRSCYGGTFYCPTDGSCDVTCGIGSDVCFGTDIFIPNDDYTGLNSITCGNQYSCEYLSIDCVTGGNSPYEWDAIHTQWVCGDFDCCPFSVADEQCTPATDCVIDCNSGSYCRGGILNATLANSLTLLCGEDYKSCDGSLILCPVGDDTKCDINCAAGQCKYATIETGTGHTMDLFNLKCGYQDCQYMDVKITAQTITNVSIDCAGGQACRFSTFSISGNNIQNLDIACRGTEDCRGTIFNIDTATIDNFNLQCGANPLDQCRSAQFNAATCIIGDLSAECEACKQMKLNTQISNSATINCDGTHACNSVDIDITSTASNANINVYCSSAAAQYSSEGSCADANMNFNGYMDPDKSNNLMINCGGGQYHSYECYSADFYALNMANADINCNGKQSCAYAKFFTQSSEVSDLSCGGNEQACRSLSIDCAYSSQNACKINCNSATDVCKSLSIFIPVSQTYAYGYLDFICNNNAQCTDIDITCRNNNKVTDYIYDSGNSEWKCTNRGTNFCCPLGITNDPTAAPSVMTSTPTNSPIAPTYQPIMSPSYQPTSKTSSPSTSPSSSPSNPNPKVAGKANLINVYFAYFIIAFSLYFV